MNNLETLIYQTRMAHSLTNKIIHSVPFDRWDEIPQGIETNVTWQAGHLIFSQHFHAIMCIAGLLPEIKEKVPLRQFAEWFTFGSKPADVVGKTEAKMLKEQLELIQAKSIEIISAMTMEELGSDLEPTKMPHPIAKTKQEALSWNQQHIFWHLGQLGMVVRGMGLRYDFGLKK